MDAEQEVCPNCGYQQPPNNNPLYLKPPFRLNRQYVIGKVLGHGGFGITYLGFDRHLNTRVAIKEYFPSEFASRAPDGQQVIPYSGEKSELFRLGREKFIAEARLLASLRSPNIVRIRHFFEESNTAYFIMEYLEGGTLTEYLQQEQGQISVEKAKEILMPLLEALEEVHAKNSYHRDIKPDNIYITQRGLPILLDFGAARQHMSGATTNLLSFLTPGFAPAEQYSSNGIQGPWTDIYALAATIYFCLTGEAPPSPQDRMMGDAELKHPSELGVEISPKDEEWLFKGLEIKWSQRPENIAEWKKLIKAADAPAAPPPNQRRAEEENFMRIAILPRLVSRFLTPSAESEIHESAGFMDISRERVNSLIEEALLMTGSTRRDPEAEQRKEKERRQKVEEERKKREELIQARELERKKEAEEEKKRREAERKAQAEAQKKAEAEQQRQEELRREAERVRREAEQERQRKLEEARKRQEALDHKGFQAENIKPSGKQKISIDELARQAAAQEKDYIQETIPEIDLDEPLQAPKAQVRKPAPEKMEPKPAPESPIRKPQAAPPSAPPAPDIPASAQVIAAPRFTNLMGMDFIKIDPLPSLFHMGKADSRYQVLLTRSYYLQTTPVTQGQWRMVMGVNPSHFQGDEWRPVEQVSWDDCQIFIQRLNSLKEGLYRLPTEAEWEFACRSAESKTYSFGSNEAELPDHAWFDGNSEGSTHPVGLKKPNAWSLYDMHGNVWEWVQDRYGPYPEGAYTDPQGSETGASRIMRGGSWNLGATYCRAESRNYETPGYRFQNLGFRLLLEIK